MSSSRNPDLVDEYARTAFERGLKVIICSTGMSGHLAAAVAARTILPVIGVPIATSPQMVGNEALAITAQMPTRGAGRDGRGRRRGERGGPRRADRGDRRPGRAGRRSGGSRTTWRRASSCDPAVRRAGALGRLVRRGPARRTGSRSSCSRSRPGPSSGGSPTADAAACRERASFTVEAVLERERVTRHDVAAFVDVVAASVGPEGRWIHFGMTSSRRARHRASRCSCARRPTCCSPGSSGCSPS